MTARSREPIVHSTGVLAIPLTRGLFALIDEADAPLVAPYLWQALKTPHTFYVKRDGPGKKCLYMHRVILGVSAGEEVDHADNDGLNNRRGNLRVATSAQNKHNTRIRRNNTSGYVGVSWNAKDGVWTAKACREGSYVHLGSFSTPEDAANVYDAFVLENRGEFARANFTHQGISSELMFSPNG